MESSSCPPSSLPAHHSSHLRRNITHHITLGGRGASSPSLHTFHPFPLFYNSHNNGPYIQRVPFPTFEDFEIKFGSFFIYSHSVHLYIL